MDINKMFNGSLRYLSDSKGTYKIEWLCQDTGKIIYGEDIKGGNGVVL